MAIQVSAPFVKPTLTRSALAVFLSTVCLGPWSSAASQLSGWQDIQEKPRILSTFKGDWLIDPVPVTTSIYNDSDRQEIILSNGLAERRWRIAPNLATVEWKRQDSGQSILRAVRPEGAIRLNGKSFPVGGLSGQKNGSFFTLDEVEAMTADPSSFQLVAIETGPTEARLPWKRAGYGASKKLDWPPPGKRLRFILKSPDLTDPENEDDPIQFIRVHVVYEMYDGLPAVSKWMEVHLGKGCGASVELDEIKTEILAIIPFEDPVERRGVEADIINEEIAPLIPPQILHVESDYAFGGMDSKSSTHTVHWKPDPHWHSQTNYRKRNPSLLECHYPLGPDVLIAPGESFISFKTFELLHDSYDRERNSIAQKRMYRIIAPWVMENPMQLHVRSQSNEDVKRAIDQAAECGFEMVLLTFGSGLNMENSDQEYLSRLKSLADYGKSKGIQLGGYSLLASRRISPDQDVIHPETGQPGKAFFGNSPCLCSEWGQDYFAKLKHFFEATGFVQLTHDGSYPGDICASTHHPGHRGLLDSQYKQFEAIQNFYHWMRGSGRFLNIPDWYYLNGASRVGMGYREVNWSLPRAQQIIIARQNIYDGVWEKLPSMGWMFVPLTQYHGGGEAATLEPLSENIADYEAHLANLLGSGVPAAYRGFRLYDTEEVKSVVKKWVKFYRSHREILNSEIIHLQRATGRDIDSIMHVNPFIQEKGALKVYNPLNEPVQRTLAIPMYYTGLESEALIRHGDCEWVGSINRRGILKLDVEVPARGVGIWFFESASKSDGE